MSWYNNSNGGTRLPDSLTMTFRITDMTSAADYEVISQRLLKLPGVTEIKPYQGEKRLEVSFSPSTTAIEQIVFQISQLGYHYFQRA